MKVTKLPILMALMLTSCSSNSSSSISQNTSNSNQITSSSVTEEKVDLELPIYFGSKAELKIDRNIYGTFIEHIDTCIYNGIWNFLSIIISLHIPL